MTQTIKERLKLLKKRNPELNEYADNYAQHIYVRNKGFNEGLDACLPLLEEVLQIRICNRKGYICVELERSTYQKCLMGL